MGFFSWLFGSKTKTEDVTKYKKGMVTASILNARKKPSAKAKVLYQLKKNTVVTVMSTEDKWYKISTQLGQAYCMREY
ncbi:MAG: SH3 domain-containing protein, partial [Bacteroidales bacterium]|nr:SH3 domain-containing protein [Bacteroidales bacterium]